MAEHSPGPWDITFMNLSHIVVDSGGEEFAKVAEVVCYPHEREEANARLISAAPDLLEACELAEKAIRLGIPQAAVQVIHEAGDYDALVLARIRLEEAIAKVRGEE